MLHKAIRIVAGESLATLTTQTIPARARPYGAGYGEHDKKGKGRNTGPGEEVGNQYVSLHDALFHFASKP